MNTPAPIFNPNATANVIEFGDRRLCVVIDDALLDPADLVEYATARRGAFRPVDYSGYPGICLPPPPGVPPALNELFRKQVRRRFDARRVLHLHCRLSMVTTAPIALRPMQWLCHSDDSGLNPRMSMPASVLYLFKDESLGGTGFYAPNCPPADIAALFRDAAGLASEVFTQKYGIRPGYMSTSNVFFNRIGGVSAKWNRLIFYDGGGLHSGDICAPERLSEDPQTGRLTLNGFFTCRRILT
jgi:hypothetical protein